MANLARLSDPVPTMHRHTYLDHPAARSLGARPAAPDLRHEAPRVERIRPSLGRNPTFLHRIRTAFRRGDAPSHDPATSSGDG